MERTVTVVCRACGHEQVVAVGAEGTYIAGMIDPDACLGCGCFDVVELANLSVEEVAEIERGEAA